MFDRPKVGEKAILVNINFNNMKKDIINKLKLNYNICIDNTVLIINRRDFKKRLTKIIKHLIRK